MASSSNTKILTFVADAAIAKGKAVKIGSDREHVAVATANTSSCIGIAQNAATAEGDLVEVARPGGGGKALAKEAITAGKFLISNADGALEQTNASGDRIIGMAMEDAVEGDIFSVEVVAGVATTSDQ
jgi:hypothetical protein